MAGPRKDLYADYDLDDWRWEFLRRNARYRRAHKAIEWLKTRLDRKKEPTRDGSFKAFGLHFSFHWFRIGEDEVWFEKWVYGGSTYRSNTNKAASEFVLELPSPDSESSREYKEKLLKKFAPAICEMDKGNLEEILSYHEIAVVVDIWRSPDEIIAEMRTLLDEIQPRKRNHVRLYPDYLAVWDLRQQGFTDSAISETLWPHEWGTSGGRERDGIKGASLQRVYDYEAAADKLIDEAFPAKKRNPQNQK